MQTLGIHIRILDISEMYPSEAVTSVMNSLGLGAMGKPGILQITKEQL